MSEHVVMGALIKCSCAKMPLELPLMVIPKVPELSGGSPGATIADCLPVANILPFGLCGSAENPTFIPLAGFGACIPLATGPWTPGSSKVLLGGIPALTKNSKAVCAMGGGQLSIVEPGQSKVRVA